MAYFLTYKNDEIYSYPYRACDGDVSKISPVDLSPDAGMRMRPGPAYSGRPVLPDNVPTAIALSGPKREIPDVYEAFGLLVSESFKTAAENLEPSVHQFFPVDLRWDDGSHAAQRYWFVPGNRLDSVDRRETTFEFRGLWDILGGADKELVFNRSQIGDRHVWIDMFIHAPHPIISDALKAELEGAGISGAHYRHCRDVE